MKNSIIVGVICALIGFAAAAGLRAAPQSQIGFYPAGPITNGQCLQVQASGNTNGLIGVACPSPTMTIGQTVNGATPSSVLTVDGNGKLSQILVPVLTAN